MKRFGMVILAVIVVVGVGQVEGAIITGLLKTGGDTALPDPAIVVGGLTSGALSYVDRTAYWEVIPGALEGADYIQTENDDKNSGVTGEVYSVTLGEAALLHVFVDQRLPGSVPLSWLTDGSVGGLVFAKSGKIVLQDFTPLGDFNFDVWTTTAAAGTYGLGEQTGASMYGIAASTIPEPASIAIWSLIGLSYVGLRVWRRRSRAGLELVGGLGRSTWTEENRAAIRAIIERGCTKS